MTKSKPSHDPVNHPSHYVAGKFEVIDIVEAYDLSFCEGNALKYLLRWRRKDGLQDLKKCAWYINRLISNEENGSKEV